MRLQIAAGAAGAASAAGAAGAAGRVRGAGCGVQGAECASARPLCATQAHAGADPSRHGGAPSPAACGGVQLPRAARTHRRPWARLRRAADAARARPTPADVLGRHRRLDRRRERGEAAHLLAEQAAADRLAHLLADVLGDVLRDEPLEQLVDDRLQLILIKWPPAWVRRTRNRWLRPGSPAALQVATGPWAAERLVRSSRVRSAAIGAPGSPPQSYTPVGPGW